MKTFKLKALSAFVAAGMMMGAGTVSAQVIGGGATLPQNLYNDIFTQTPLPAFNTYVGTGSGTGKTAFFTNNGALFNAPGQTVDYAGSDSLIDQSNVDSYDEVAYGALIQIPSVLTSVTVPYNVTGVTDLNLTSDQLAQIFSRQITNWSEVGGPDLGITVVFRKEGSGTTEIFLRHLNAVNSTAVPSVSNNFASVFGLNADNPGAGYISVEGSGGVPTAVNGLPGAIGYVSPDFVDETSNAEVARVNGTLPTEVNVQAAIEEVPVPTTDAQRRNPLAWGISNPIPSQGYPIVASTNLILSQCYQSATDNARIRDALNKLYGAAGTWDSQITAHGFIPLPPAWKTAIHQTFWNQADSLELAVGDPAECTPGRGRPS